MGWKRQVFRIRFYNMYIVDFISTLTFLYDNFIALWYGWTMADYWKLYNEVKLFFKNNKEIFCPALKIYIQFNRKGLRHILQKNHTQRHIPDQIRRFKLLLSIRKILENERLAIDMKDDFYILSLVIDQRIIKIVTVRNIIGKFRFISIMEHKMKHTTRKAPKGLS